MVGPFCYNSNMNEILGIVLICTRHESRVIIFLRIGPTVYVLDICAVYVRLPLIKYFKIIRNISQILRLYYIVKRKCVR